MKKLLIYMFLTDRDKIKSPDLINQLGIIHLVCLTNFPKNYTRVSGVKNIIFSEHFSNLLRNVLRLNYT